MKDGFFKSGFEMKIGILQTGHVPDDLAERHGQYPEMFEKFLSGHGFELRPYAVVDGIFPKDIDECDGWLITGSRHGAYEDHDWIPPLEVLIRELYQTGKPMVGICFGHQIMAQALGGKVEKFGGSWGVGTNEYSHPDGTKTKLLAMHQDQVIEKPADAEVIATSDFCKFAGFSYKNNALSYQAHPEFTPGFVEELIKIRAGSVIPEDQASPALTSINTPNDSEKYAQEIAAFFKSA